MMLNVLVGIESYLNSHHNAEAALRNTIFSQSGFIFQDLALANDVGRVLRKIGPLVLLYLGFDVADLKVGEWWSQGPSHFVEVTKQGLTGRAAHLFRCI